MNVNEASKRLLDDTYARALLFLRTIPAYGEIRSAMWKAGYDDAEARHGMQLLRTAWGRVPSKVRLEADDRARSALAELDEWDEPGFRRAHAALERLHPEQDAFVFGDLEPARGAGSIAAVAVFLDRLNALESSPDRVATRAADHAALATLEKRGIGKAERARLQGLLDSLQDISEPSIPDPLPGVEEREAARRELRAWYRDWSQTARAVIRRRDHLMLLGLAHRRRSDERTEEPAPAPVVEGAPV